MKCWKCGAESSGDGRFCPHCGADQQMAPSEPPKGPDYTPPQGPGYTPPQGPNYTPPQGPAGGSWSGAGASASNETVLNIFAAICAVIYGVAAVRGLIGIFRFLFQSVFAYFSFTGLISTAFNLLVAALNAVVCLILVMFILKRTQDNTGGLLILLGIGGVGLIAVRLIQSLFNLIAYQTFSVIGPFLRSVLGVFIVIGGIYAILRFLLGEEPLAGKSQAELTQELRSAMDSLGKTATEAAQGAKASWDSAQQNRQQDAQQTQWQAQAGTDQAQWQGQRYNNPTPPPNGYSVTRLSTDRSLLKYILLNLITCGIYSWYFLYTVARDVNVACAGDGKQTAGLLKFILLSFITCGIYSWIWYYSLGNRLAENAPRYGLNFQENGTTILLWMLLGALLCGVGPFIALHILIKNLNTICGAYNHWHGI